MNIDLLINCNLPSSAFRSGAPAPPFSVCPTLYRISPTQSIDSIFIWPTAIDGSRIVDLFYGGDVVYGFRIGRFN